MKPITLTVQTAQVVASGAYRVYKTERFTKQTARILRTDDMLDAVAGGLLQIADKLSKKQGDGTYFYAATDNNLHVFWFCFAPDSLIFVGYDSTVESVWREDTRFAAFLSANTRFTLTVAQARASYPKTDFAKLYRLSLTDGVYFPCLNRQQRELVAIEDANVLVQGVAGSGKTNVCIDKIIFCACRNYGGQVLYTTFSRGLLMDTKMRVERWKANVNRMVAALNADNVVFTDQDKQAAVVNRLGLYLAEDCADAITAKLQQIAAWLDTHVEYKLIEDVYTSVTGQTARYADEDYFVHTYMGEMRNYYLAGRLDKIRELSGEVIYKEIFGLIEGWCNPDDCAAALTREDYRQLRQDSFGKSECDTIYGIAQDYRKHLEKEGRCDNNTLSRALLTSGNLPAYSLIIADEVQDFSQVTLVLLSKMGRKTFAVGDALQMINPSYFNFAYLKRLLFDKETARVTTLTHNYRSGQQIQAVIEQLGQLNEARFGTHNFVLRGQSVGDETDTDVCFVPDDGMFAEQLRQADLGDVTVIVGDRAQKDRLRRALPQQEVLTVSEIKGLERDTVLLYHLLGANMAQWQTLERKLINRKTADENSVYRYYFNLFYVGASRAKRHLFVLEQSVPRLFDDVVAALPRQSESAALDALRRVAGKKLDEAEQLARLEQFVALGQYENALVAAAKLPDAPLQAKRVQIYAQYVKIGQYRRAGIAFWQLGCRQDAEKCFTLGNEHALLDLMQTLASAGETRLGADMIQYWCDLEGNEDARHALLGVIQDDLARLQDTRKQLHGAMRAHKKGV